MPLTLHKPIAWLLVAAVTLVAGVGEALHGIPGCGHGIEIGDRIVLLGISVPSHLQVIDAWPHLEQTEGPEIPIYGEGECVICSALGQTSTSADSIPFTLVLPWLHDLPAAVLLEIPTGNGLSFHARAPPISSFQIAGTAAVWPFDYLVWMV